MKLLNFILLLAILPMHSFANDKKDKKVEVVNVDGLKGPTQKFGSLEELMQALRSQSEHHAKCTDALQPQLTTPQLEAALEQSKSLFRDLPADQQTKIVKYIHFDLQKLSMMLKLI